MKSRGKPNLLKQYLIPAVILAVIFFFLGKNIVGGWGDLREWTFTLKPLPLLGSLALFVVAFACLVGGWRSIVGRFSFRIPFLNSFRIVIQAALGRYIPGKVWAPAGLVYLGSKWGIPAKEGTVCAILSTVLLIVAGILFSILWVIGNLGLRENPFVIPLLLTVGAAILVLHPRVLFGVLNRGLKALKKEPLDISYRYLDLLKSFPFYLLFWIGMGGGFVLAVKALIVTDSQGVRLALVNSANLFPLMSIYALTYVAGVVAIFAPGGLGVREGMMALLLASYFNPPLPSLISVYGRLWATLLEGILFIAVLFIPSSPRKAPEGGEAPD